MILTSRFSLLLPLWLLLVFGCGGPKKSTVAQLSGSVKYKGNLVTAGTMTLTVKGEENKAGGTYFVSIDPDGKYSTSQLPAGEYDVTIETESANTNRPQYGGGKGGDQMVSPVPEGVGSGPKGAYVKIPTKYADPKTSGLTVSVKSGKNTKDFDLTD